MNVYRCKNCGFCFGVKRAIEQAKQLNKGSFILGEIIHNEKVNEELKNSGLVFIEDITDEKLKENSIVLFRTHGEPKSVFDYANSKKIKIIDCTCPFVKQIQKIVFKYYTEGYKIVIIGDKTHPEVIGINGWCNNSALITENYLEIQNLQNSKICVVVQTTYSESKFQNIIKNFKYNDDKLVDIFKTICYTTTERQRETVKVASKSDVVIVIGGKKSNNTNNLFEISKKYCKNCFKIASADEFDFDKIKNYKNIGIVLGASTPFSQFQEVISTMDNNTEELKVSEVSEQNGLEADQSAKTEVKIVDDSVKSETKTADEKSAKIDEKAAVEGPAKSEMEAAIDKIKPSRDFKIGQIITAKISSASASGLSLSIKDTKSDFELPKEEMLNEYDKDSFKDKIGTEIRVMVVGKKPVRFSEKAMEKVLKEEADIEEIRNGKIFEAEITATNKGGLTGKYGSYQVFIPASQIKLGFVKDLEKYVGKTLRLKASKIECKGPRRQIVGSQKVILLAEKEEKDAIYAAKKAEFFGNIQVNDVVLGTPVRFTAFGAFVQVNGFDCLCHISDLSWTNCKECGEVLEIGKTYEFKILKIEEDKERVSLGYKQLQPKPWDLIGDKYKIGDVVKGKVVRIVSFGAFVEVEKGIDGLVHVSQISNEWLENPVTALTVGQEVDCKILDINPEKEKMTLSIKALLPEVAKNDNAEQKGKKKYNKDNSEFENDMHEWKEDNNNGASIAEMLGNSDK